MKRQGFVWAIVLVGLIVAGLQLRHQAQKSTQESGQASPQVSSVGTTQTASESSKIDSAGRKVATTGGRIPSPRETEGELRRLFQDASDLNFSLSEDGQVVSVTGNLANVQQDPQAIERILRSMGQAYGLSPEEVGPPQKDSKGGFSDLYVSKQIHQGLEVFGGGLQASTVRATGNVFVVGAYVYPVGTLNLAATLTIEEAEAIMRSHYKGKGVSLMTPSPQTVIYSMDGPDKSEKAYVFQVSVFDSKPKFVRVAVGFESRRVVYELPLSYH